MKLKKIFFTLTALWMFFLLTGTAVSAKSDFSEIESKYGLTVKYTIDEDFFPSNWMESPINARATAIEKSELKRTARAMLAALSKYSPGFIRKNLKGIYLTKEIFFYGQPYGATNSTDIIYVNNKGEANGYTDEFLEGSFHHEFAHILQRNFEFPRDQWSAANPKNFKYKTGGVDAIKSGEASLEGSEKTWKMGFLSQYSMSELDEDVCVYSEKILMNDQKAMDAIAKYPVLQKKYKIWLGFYQSLNSGIGAKDQGGDVKNDDSKTENADSDEQSSKKTRKKTSRIKKAVN